MITVVDDMTDQVQVYTSYSYRYIFSRSCLHCIIRLYTLMWTQNFSSYLRPNAKLYTVHSKHVRDYTSVSMRNIQEPELAALRNIRN